MGRGPRNQSVGGVPRHCDSGASDEETALGTDRQHRVHPWPRRFNTQAAYVAAKHGLVGLTKVVGLETAGSGVTCNAVCPGWVRTPLVEKQISDIAAQRTVSQKEAARELLAEKQPSLEFVSPSQLGGTVAF